MGSFPGHALPGSIFIFLGLWWMHSAWLRYFICRYRQKPYYVSISFPFHCCSAGLKLPLESFIVLFGTSLGIVVELGTGLEKTVDQDGISSYSFAANNLQHFTMYFMFFLVGIVELLQHYHIALPSHIGVVVGILAFSAEGLLFYFHVHARDPVDIQLHILLVLSIGAIIISSICELAQPQPKQVYPTLMRAYFTVLQGSWFYQIAFILYSPFHAHYDFANDPVQHRTLMLISYYFVWHMSIILLILLLFAIGSYYLSKRYRHVADLGYEQSFLIHETNIDISDNYQDAAEYDVNMINSEKKVLTNGRTEEKMNIGNSL
ncbi:unnamed protein product [Didymodactylos carnosus]|uniref:Transmembrane protein 45B n=1 Tax=Didymodactylos carnosus TaxID=1234261 RepID=A0A813ZBD2_9BILA|nr:unnamed protein product [Didymodactylos carnosus]CAF0912382.1 unnamed protein product [Didymodactylos carnosus]CAF3679218.1 unnamed protein product [Didymodactylos carnosus]CAF3691266.1 unnamed protein product [Didymodactylos carnosus]